MTTLVARIAAARARFEAAFDASLAAERAAYDARRAESAAYVEFCDLEALAEGRVAARVDGLRRAVTSRPVEAATRRPAHETAALLAGSHDDGLADAERAAARFDGAGGVARADRVDDRVWILSIDADGNDVWLTHPDPVVF